MKTYEVLARRYCALLGEDPDEIIQGLPAWRIALVDLEAAIHALETFGVEARAPMNDEAFNPDNWSSLDDVPPPPGAPKKENILPFRRVA